MEVYIFFSLHFYFYFVSPQNFTLTQCSLSLIILLYFSKTKIFLKTGIKKFVICPATTKFCFEKILLQFSIVSIEFLVFLYCSIVCIVLWFLYRFYSCYDCNWKGLILNLHWICFCGFNPYFAAFVIISIHNDLPQGK